MKDLLKKLFGLGLSKDAIIAPHGAILTLGEDRRGVPHGTTRNANTLLLGAGSRQRVERVIVPTLLRGTSASYIVDDPTGEVYDLTAATRAKLGPVSRVRWRVPPQKTARVLPHLTTLGTSLGTSSGR